ALNAGRAARIAVYSENLDLVRCSGPRYEEILKTYLREKYRDRPIGVIATIGPAALSFMLRARPELWPDVPAIFASVDPETAAQAQIPVGVTGLVRRQPCATRRALGARWCPTSSGSRWGGDGSRGQSACRTATRMC